MKQIKLMLLGISIILFGGILMLDPYTELKGLEFLLVLIGFFITIIGFTNK